MKSLKQTTASNIVYVEVNIFWIAVYPLEITSFRLKLQNA